MRLAFRLALSALSAALMLLSVPTFDLWPLMWIGLLPALHVALTAATPRRAFLQGWLTGILANTAAFYWMKGLLERFGHMPGIEAIPIMMLLTTYQGLEFGFWAWGVHRLARRRPNLPLAWAAPLVMVVIELVVPQIFPFYLAISQAWVPPVIQIADLTGPMGVTFVLVMVTGALYDAGRAVRAGGAAGGSPVRAGWRKLRIPAAIVVAVLGYGVIRIHQIERQRAVAPKARVGIVQANIGISEKWDPNERGRLLRLHQDLSSQLSREGADLIVWPESSYPYAISREMAADYPLGDPRRIRGPETTPMIFGAVTLDPDRRSGRGRFPYNTALMLDESGRIAAKFDKVFLLIFGEYIPFYDRIPWFTKVFPEACNFNRGETPGKLSLSSRGPRLSSRPAHLLRGHPARVHAPDRRPRSEPAGEHHERRLVRQDVRAVPAPGARRVSLGREPAGDGPLGEHRRVGAHRRRRAGASVPAGGGSRYRARARADEAAGRGGSARPRGRLRSRRRSVRVGLPPGGGRVVLRRPRLTLSALNLHTSNSSSVGRGGCRPSRSRAFNVLYAMVHCGV
jgi:apolipoprotein N-acyltransferase